MKLRCGFWIALFALSLLSQRSEGQTTLPVTDSHLFFSPFNWNVLTTSTFPVTSVTNEPGAYLILQVSNGNTGANTISVNIDQGGGSLPDSSMTVQYQVIQSGALYSSNTSGVSSNVSITIPSGVSTVRFFYSATGYSTDRWNATATLTNTARVPIQTLRITGVTLASGVSIQSPSSLRPKRMLFYGDSITEGSALAAGSTISVTNDATKTYAVQCAALLNAEYGTVGNAGQGWTINIAP